MTGFPDADRERIDAIPLSIIAAHPDHCCADGRQALLRRLGRYPELGSRLAAVPVLLPWGPVRWPAHWCEVMGTGGAVGDCGVHADVGSALLTEAGVPHRRGRVALAAEGRAIAHWRAGWQQAECPAPWIGSRIVHHEVLRVGDRWWDPSGACWFDGAGAWLASGPVVAVRLEGGHWEVGP